MRYFKEGIKLPLYYECLRVSLIYRKGRNVSTLIYVLRTES